MVEAVRYRVFIVEDHSIFLEGLTRCLDAESDFRVVGGTVDWRPEAPGTLFVLRVPRGQAMA
jgi:DNA-binding NarL/FixJ family response regulator